MVILSYLFYLCSVCCCNDILDYLNNTKKLDDYQSTYDKMVEGRGYFTFWIECYHNVTTGHGKHRRTRKVVTHTASQKFYFTECVDESGEITDIEEVKNFIFLHYIKRYYFADDRS